MVVGYHCIFSTYGFWLPNDPRGSWSDCVRAWELAAYGGPAKVNTRQSRAGKPHDTAKRLAAKEALKYPEVIFNGVQARAVARGFEQAISESGYILHACSIMPQHVHLVVARGQRMIEQVIGHLKARATQRLRGENLHPLTSDQTPSGSVPSPWTQRKGWTVYLNSSEDITRSIRYVEDNPLREGLPRQRWSFVTPFTV